MLTGPACDGSAAGPAAGVLLELPHAPTPTARRAAVASIRSLRVRIVVLSMRAEPFVTKRDVPDGSAGGRAGEPAYRLVPNATLNTVRTAARTCGADGPGPQAALPRPWC